MITELIFAASILLHSGLLGWANPKKTSVIQWLNPHGEFPWVNDVFLG